MAGKRHKPEEIVTKLRHVDVLVGQRMTCPDAIRQVSITEQTYYRWRKQRGEGISSPARRRMCIDRVRGELGVFEHRACRVLGQHRSTQRLVADMIELARQYGRYGSVKG